MNADWAPGGHQPLDQTNRFGLWVRRKIGCYHPQTPSPFNIITQLVSLYSFYRPTEGGRLSRPRHCSKGAQPVPKAVYRSDCRDIRWDSNLGPLAPQSGVLPLSHRSSSVSSNNCCCRVVGLLKVVSRNSGISRQSGMLTRTTAQGLTVP